MFIFAHFSDAHLVAPFSRGGWLLNTKQALALGNWWWRRRWQQRTAALQEAVAAIIARRADAVLITGDQAQLGRDVDYEYFREFMKPLQKAEIPVLLLAGNHDYYSTAPCTYQVFTHLREELSLSLRWDGGPLRLGGLDILPVDGACPTPPFQCWGNFPENRLASLRTAWETLPPDAGQTRIACGHFPLRCPKGEILPDKLGLRGSEEVLAFLQQAKVQAYLCGHIHRNFIINLPGNIPQYCAGSLTCNGCLHFFAADAGTIKLL